MAEIFKDIPGYEGLYQVSNKGRIKSLERMSAQGHLLKEKIMNPQLSHHGYLRIKLHKNGNIKVHFIHRLVAKAFISNPNNYPIINHKDYNPSNNCVENLEWCTSKYNNNYGTRNEKLSNSLINNPKRSTQIKCLDLETNKITYYPSIREISRQFDVYSTIIWRYIYRCNKPYKNRYIFTEIEKEKD